MEIELKYSIDGKEKAERLWEALLSDVCMAEGLQIVKGSQKETAMKAVYFDAGDGRLSQETIAVRVRQEGESIVATVKWDKPLQDSFGAQPSGPAQSGASISALVQGSDGALHVHQEINVEDVPEAWLSLPPKNPFPQTAIGARIEALLSQEPQAQLLPLLSTEFLRRSVLLRCQMQGCGELLCEAAVDTGAIVAGKRSEPICELELELKQGDAQTLSTLGERVARRYGLTPGTKSKFQRGRELLRRQE